MGSETHPLHRPDPLAALAAYCRPAADGQAVCNHTAAAADRMLAVLGTAAAGNLALEEFDRKSTAVAAGSCCRLHSKNNNQTSASNP